MGGRDADAFLAKALGVVDQRLRDDLVPDDLSVVIEVVDEEVERLQPLVQAGLDAAPFADRYDAGDDVERSGAVVVFPVTVDSEGDALVDNRQFSA